MDRSTWLKEKRRRIKERMDILWAPLYDEKWGQYPNNSHLAMLDRFLALCPPGGTILDAACGTGKYWTVLLASGRAVVGTDQSGGMLARAQEKFPAVTTEKIGLQELRFSSAFEGIICVDAMEFVFPEDWPLVLANFHRALKPGGYLYFTVELPEDQAALQASFAAAQQQGLPVVRGEWAHEDGYHYYPSIEQVRMWLGAARFDIIKESIGDDYHHFLTRKLD